MALSDVRIWDGTQFVSIAGPKGDTGAPGAAATIAVGNYEVGPWDDTLDIVNTGTANAAVLDFRIPAGKPGDAATIAVGAVTTGPAGGVAVVTNTGTPQAAVLNFTIPQGAKGDPGKDGTGVSIKGTATTWPPAASPTAGDMYILGDPVPGGAPGGSKPGDGVVWTGTAWNNVGSIQGPKGDKGDAGPAYQVVISGTLNGLPGTQASVVDESTTPNVSQLKFTIPVGAKGDKGDAGANAEVYSQPNQPTAQRVGALWLVTT